MLYCVMVNMCGCPVPLNHAKLSTGGAASLLHVRVTDPPSETSATGKTPMEVELGPSGG